MRLDLDRTIVLHKRYELMNNGIN